MGTTEDNAKLWSEYNWQHQGGDEWSAAWGGTDQLWWATIMPRIHSFVPSGTILEIAPGFGRCTQYLKELGQHLILVDIAEVCIAACQQRFSSSTHITYHVNDGKSLAMVPDQSVDFVFSFDSLVHADADVLEAYLGQLARKLSPNGVGFIHHSNLGAYRTSQGRLRFYINNEPGGESNWRAASMTAELFEEYCERVGLQCISQELIGWSPASSLRGVRPPWRGGVLSHNRSQDRRTTVQGQPMRKNWIPKAKLSLIRDTMIEQFPGILNDCFSVFTLQHSTWARENKVVANKRFMSEARNVARLSELYYFE